LAGDITLKYGGSPLTLTVTNLQSLASNSTFTSGWTSAWIDNTSVLALDYLITANIAAGTTPTTPCSVRVYAYSQHSDGSTAPDLFSSGTEGTEGAATVHDTEILDSGLVLLWSSDIDATTNDNYTMPARSIAAAFGQVPRKFALYIAHNCTAALRSSLNAVYADPILNAYT
jgi:hypothetical protein